MAVPEPLIGTVPCPTCGRTVEAAVASFPFCSPRCRLRDLGAWLDGRHVIPGAPWQPGDEDGEP
ncbi:MAG: DNA gyrase inhibitor YacG [Planctomycetes bacterium]|nr:DNA gyrase inhibitor YacG [Planctomycetota bacterium]